MPMRPAEVQAHQLTKDKASQPPGGAPQETHAYKSGV